MVITCVDADFLLADIEFERSNLETRTSFELLEQLTRDSLSNTFANSVLSMTPVNLGTRPAAKRVR